VNGSRSVAAVVLRARRAVPDACAGLAFTRAGGDCIDEFMFVHVCTQSEKNAVASQDRTLTLSQLYRTRQPARLQKDVVAFSARCVPILARTI
jgi:hypothetical protein